MKVCSIEGCDKKHEGLGYCKSHYRRFKKYGDPLATPIRIQKVKNKSREVNHKYIDNIEHKICNDCEEWFPSTIEYFYKNKNSKDGLASYCKVCTNKRVEKYQNENREVYLESQKNYYRTHKEEKKQLSKRLRNENLVRYQIYIKDWQQSNPDKVRGYNLKRTMNKTHDITDEEWFTCLDYFNNSCAYCGLSEKEQFELYNENFHMEHVFHNGSNYINNCVPSCTSCNTSKFTFEINDWYNEENPVFAKYRYNKIVKWMTEECFNVLNLR